MQRMTRENKSEVVEVLAAAFRDYPVMRYVLRSAGDDYEQHLRDLVGFFCEARYVKNGHVLGIREGQELAAAALIDEPVHLKSLTLKSELRQLEESIGTDAFKRLEKYETITSAEEPQEPHWFLGTIGVHPKKQGKGYARILMDYARQMSEQDPRSAGVCLSTEDPENVKFYKRFGYHVLSEVDVDELHSWCLFLPTRASSVSK